jgi:hypothetical protein
MAKREPPETHGTVAECVAFIDETPESASNALFARKQSTLHERIAFQVWIGLQSGARYTNNVQLKSAYSTATLTREYLQLRTEVFLYEAERLAREADANVDFHVHDGLFAEICAERPEFADRMADLALRMTNDMQLRAAVSPAITELLAQNPNSMLFALLAQVAGWKVY